MKLLYTSDLHGNKNKYVGVIESAFTHKADAVILGGDLLPFGNSIVKTQLLFIPEFLKFAKTLTIDLGISLYYILGNNDLKIFDTKLIMALDGSGLDNVHWIDHRPKHLGNEGLWIIGVSEICDLPFELKDRCRLDISQDKPFRELQKGNAYFSSAIKMDLVKMDINDYAKHLLVIESLEDILNGLQIDDWSKTILVTHDPPYGTGLDVTSWGNAVGSRAILEFIEKKQPMFSLHGHIHESPNKSGIWHNTIISTISIQPGQPFRELSYVIIDTETYETERYEE